MVPISQQNNTLSLNGLNPQAFELMAICGHRVVSIKEESSSKFKVNTECTNGIRDYSHKPCKGFMQFRIKQTGTELYLGKFDHHERCQEQTSSGLLGGDKKGSSELKSLPTDKSDSPRSAPARGEEPKGVDLTSVKLDIDDVFLPMNKQAEEWAETLLNRLPDSVRKVVDVEDLARRLTDKALEMDIRDGLILPEGSESPFNRNSVSRKAIRRKKGTEASKPSTSVTEALKEAVVKQEQKIKALAANLHTTADTKKQGVVQELVRFFEDVIEQHRIEAGKGFTGRSSTWL